jgi:flagellar motor protein MotB
MTNKSRLLLVSLVSTTMLTGCVVWQSDYDKLQGQNEQLQQEVSANQQQISRLQGAIKYTVNSDLLFAPGSWQMRPQGQQIIANLAKKLAPTQRNPLTVAGYTDNTPIGPELRQGGVTSNQELSQKSSAPLEQWQGVKSCLPKA